MTETQIQPVALNRALSLPLLVLYGLGVTVGAGIYVLVGATAGIAGTHAPVAFVIAACVMAPSAASFAELACRYPVSAGEAAYVRAGFNSGLASLVVGLGVVGAGVVSSAALGVGSAGYVREFVSLPPLLLAAAVIVLMGLAAAWGIVESVLLASILTLVEIGGLLAIVAAGIWGGQIGPERLPELLPLNLDGAMWAGIIAASLISFFAFIGFEDIVNVAEEAREPKKTLPRAIAWTLGVTTLLYVLVVCVSVLAVPPQELARSSAPLTLVFERAAAFDPAVISAIAVVATLNTIIVQIIMSSRVIYGLATQGNLPRVLSRVNARTRTPLLATALVVGIVLVLALSFDLEGLARSTSNITLSVFTLVNLALLRIKLRGDAAEDGNFTVPAWVPAAGALSSAGLLASQFF